MAMFQKKGFLFSLLILIGVYMFSCKKDDSVAEEPDLTSHLSIVESTIPTQDLLVGGGSITFQIDWAYNQFEVLVGEVVEGASFITQITPATGGDVKASQTVSTVKVTYASNLTYQKNKQKVIVKSLTNADADTIVLTQVSKVFKPINLTIDPSTTYQTISGFGGASPIWGTDYLTTSEMDLTFGASAESIGLSILRVRLSSVKSDWAGLVNTVKKANELNVKVLATPWSPPATWKSNSSSNGGGYLLEANYADFAAYINEFIQYMATNGATIDVVSIQNEPDWKVSYEGCEYTTDQMLKFVKEHAGSIVGAKVAAAESLNSNQTYTSGILNDAVAVDNIDIVAGHLYGGGLKTYPLAEQKGKEIWMTEHLYNLDSGNNSANWTATTSQSVIWAESMQMVNDINTAMTYNWNAYIWWYIRRFYSFIGDGERGTTRNTILKRGYAMSQFAKFIRPGYVRIAAQLETSTTGLKISAYKGDDKMVVVIVNPTALVVSGVTLNSPNVMTSAMSYTTSLNKNREQVALTPADKKVTVDMQPNSITTIVIN